MSILTKPYFRDEEAAFAFLEAIIWPTGPVCPHCGATGRITKVKANPEKRVRFGLHRCGDCKKQFTVKIGTVFEESKVPLHKWLQAAYLMCASKKGISSHQLHRTLEVTYKTAWFMTHRLREAMRDGALPVMGGEGSVIEADETYFGNQEGYVKKGKRGPAGKRAVVGLVERGGSVRTFHVDRATKATVGEIVTANIRKETALMTDESRLYGEVGQKFLSHETVRHSSGEYVRGLAHTNTIEGFFSIFKRGMKGVYQHCSEKHLHRYLAEFDFRYNNRARLGVEDQERTANALRGIVGKRLLYRPEAC